MSENQADVVQSDITREHVEHYLQSAVVKLTDAEKEQFISTAVLFQLDPFKRELHPVVYTENGNRKVNLIVGYEVYIKKAERTGLLDGWKAWSEGNGDSMKAVVEIQRKDWSKPFIHEVYWAEAVQRTNEGSVLKFWEKMPRFQLKKVAISQGFRLCFSNEIGGIPYDGSELPYAEASPVNEVEPSKPIPQSQTEQKQVEPKMLSQNLSARDVQNLLSENKDMFSAKHLEWIQNRLEEAAYPAQINGLKNHIITTIGTGGDYKKSTSTYKRPAYKKNYSRSNSQYPAKQAQTAQALEIY